MTKITLPTVFLFLLIVTASCQKEEFVSFNNEDLNSGTIPGSGTPSGKQTICENPTNLTRSFNVFVRENLEVYNGQFEGPAAIGGTIKVHDSFSVSSLSAGTYKVGNDTRPCGLITDGAIILDYGARLHILSEGYLKLSKLNNLIIHDTDTSGAPTNTRVTNGSFDGDQSISLSVHQTATSIKGDDEINFDLIFGFLNSLQINVAAMEETTTIDVSGTTGTIVLTPSKANVLNITLAELIDLDQFSFSPVVPSEFTPVVFNIIDTGDLIAEFPNLLSANEEMARYVSYNFVNAQSLTLEGGTSIYGSILAPKTTIDKAMSGDIIGQVTAKSLIHRGGKVRYKPFDAIVCSPLISIPLDVFSL